MPRIITAVHPTWQTSIKAELNWGVTTFLSGQSGNKANYIFDGGRFDQFLAVAFGKAAVVVEVRCFDVRSNCVHKHRAGPQLQGLDYVSGTL